MLAYNVLLMLKYKKKKVILFIYLFIFIQILKCSKKFNIIILDVLLSLFL